MAFANRRSRGYEAVPRQRINSGDWCSSDRETSLISNVVANHAQALQVNGGGIGFGPDFGAIWGVEYPCTAERGGDVLVLPLSEIVTGIGYVRVNLYLEMDTATDYAYMIANAGRSVEKVYLENTTSLQYVVATIPIETITNPMLINDLVLGIRVGVDNEFGTGTNKITVRTISVYEVPDLTLGPYYQDTSGATNRLVSDSYPYSAAVSRLIATNTNIIRQQRVPRGQIFQHAFRANSGYPSPTAYTATEDYGGRWKIVLGAGINTLAGVVSMTFTADADVRVSVWSVDSIQYSSEVNPFTVGMLLVGGTSGAMATVTLVYDAGSGGALGLGHVTGEFIHGESIVGYDPYGATNGSATADTSVTGPLVIDTHDETTFGSATSNEREVSLSLPGANRQWAEYEIRLGFKCDSSTTIHRLVSLSLGGQKTSSDVAELPNPLHVETEDDVLASTYRKAKEVNELMWGKSSKLVLSMMYKRYNEEYLKTKTTGDFETDRPEFYREASGLLSGIGNNLVAKIWYSRVPKTFQRLDVTSVSGVRTVGDKITGGTTGATAIVREIRTGPDSLSIDLIKGSFKSGETITFTSTGTSVVSGEMYDYQATQTLRFGIFKPDEWIVYKDIDLSQAQRNIESYLEIEITIPEKMLDDIDVYSSGILSPYDLPISWVIQTTTDDLSDYIITNKYLVFERVSAPGQWTMSQEDNDN